MVEVKELDGGYGLWIYDYCRPESEPEEVGCDAHVVSLMTSVVINMDGMDASCM